MSKPTLGIIGGGQLGSMLATAAKKLGIRTIVFCDDIDSPAQKFSDEFIAYDVDCYGVKYDGVSLSADMENEHVLKDIIPSRRRMDQQDIINETIRGDRS